MYDAVCVRSFAVSCVGSVVVPSSRRFAARARAAHLGGSRDARRTTDASSRRARTRHTSAVRAMRAERPMPRRGARRTLVAALAVSCVGACESHSRRYRSRTERNRIEIEINRNHNPSKDARGRVEIGAMRDASTRAPVRARFTDPLRARVRSS